MDHNAARKYGKFVTIIAFLLLLFIFSASIFFRPLNHYKPFFEKIASQALHQPVTIGKVAGAWHGLLPVIDLDHITIYDATGQIKQLQAEHLQFSLNLLKSLTHWSLMPDTIYLSGAKLYIEQFPNDTWAINGIKIQPKGPTSTHPIEDILTWLKNYEQIGLAQVDVHLKKMDGTEAAIKNLQLLLTPVVGALKLDADHTKITSPQLFTEPLTFERIKLDLTGLETRQGWKLSVKQLFLSNADLKLQAVMDVNFHKNDKDILLHANFSDNKITQLLKYLPRGMLSEKLNAWLKTALVNGDSVHGKVLLQGPLSHFPFADGKGRFQANLQIENTDLHYLSGWPDLTNIYGHLKFNNNSLSADVVNAKVLGVDTHAIHAEIPDLHHATLKLHWNSDAKYSDLSRFVFASPLNAVIGDTFRYLDYTGPTHLTIDLIAPLYESKGLKVNGHYVLKPEGILKIPAYQIVLNKVQGALQFTENSVNAKEIKGQWLGQPTAINIVTRHNAIVVPLQNPSIETDVNIIGGLSLPEVIKNYHLDFLTPILTGVAPYKAKLTFTTLNDKVHTGLLVNSNLVGVGVNLPVPLKKTPEQSQPTVIKLESADNKANIFFDYGKKLSAALALEHQAQTTHLVSGDIELGGKPAKLPNTSGLIVNAKIPSLNLSELGQYFSSSEITAKKTAKPAKAGGKERMNIKNITLNIDKLSAFGITVDKVLIQVKQMLDAWLIKVNGVNLQGYISIPFDLSSDKFIKANFQRVCLTSSTVNATQKNVATKKVMQNISYINPQQIPSLDLIFQNVYIDKHPLGTICFLTMRQKNAMQITRLSVDFPLFRFLAMGHWRSINGKPSTILGGYLKTKNLGMLLSDWNLTKSLKGAKGFGSFTLSWPGPLYEVDTHKLNGKFAFDFEKGEILNVINNRAEAGLGRILNLLTIQSLQNLLLKPFSILTPKTSFDFDDLTGDFTVTNGNAETKDALIKGDLAKIETEGRIGLGAKDYDLSVKITPFLTSSLAGASIFIGGPIVAAGVWVINKLIGGILNGLFSTTYHVTGSWTDPVFEKV
ncbi:MAG TPA: DUF3971 domain-containing protein [Gammaproteobacteria bacterium]|nr:DUF3971 domain-containing protein [Gammaproteobacteria bacterium]